MHRAPSRWALAAFLACLYLPPLAQAQQGAEFPASDVERLGLNPGRGSLLVGGGELLLPGKFRVALIAHYQRAPLRMTLEGQRLDLISHRGTTVVTGALGVLPWLEVDLQIPLVIMQTGADPSAYGLRPVASRGLGTPTALARMGVLSRRAGHVFDLAVDLGLSIPVGSALAMAREPLPRLQTAVLIGRRLGPVRATIDGGLLLRVPGELVPAKLTHSRQGQELRLGAALGTTGDGLRFEGALRSTFALGTEARSTELFVGARYPLFQWLEVFGLGGIGLGSLPGTPGFRMLLGVAAGPPPPPEIPFVRRARSSQEPMPYGPGNNQGPRPLVPQTAPNDAPAPRPMEHAHDL